MENEIIDNYQEHELHEYWDKHCSACYSDMKATLEKYKVGVKLESNNQDRTLGYMAERSAHPEERYW